jgi:PelA/Pel-15E family pectate lyase
MKIKEIKLAQIFTAMIMFTILATIAIPAYADQKTFPFSTAILPLNSPNVWIDNTEKSWTSDKQTSLTIIDDAIYFPTESAKDLFGNLLESSNLEKDSKLINGKTYLPLRVAFENANCIVAWDSETQTVIITTGKEGNIGSVSWKNILKQPTWWYGSDEAIRIANNILYYQRNNGGWVKNTDMTTTFTEKEIEQFLNDKNKNDATIDNGATTTQMEYIAKVYSATKIDRFKDSFYKALDALLLAQYDNGGLPQYLTDTSGYRAQITYNDNAMIHVFNLFASIAKKSDSYAFISDDYATKCAYANEKGLDCILKTQLIVDGIKTGWCQQYDHITMQPAKARAYELPSNSGSESVSIVRYLMSIENPSDEVIDAVRSAVAWFEKVKITGIAVKDIADPSVEGGKNRVVIEDPSITSPLWARFYDLDTNKPFFVGRDSIKKDTFAEVEFERRMGYSYYGNWAQKLLETEYPAWEAKLNK